MIKGSARDEWGRFSSVAHGVVLVAFVHGLASASITFESLTCEARTESVRNQDA